MLRETNRLLSLESGVLMARERSSAYHGCRVAPACPTVNFIFLLETHAREVTKRQSRDGSDCRKHPSLNAGHDPKFKSCPVTSCSSHSPVLNEL
jgi:hypothetical protein